MNPSQKYNVEDSDFDSKHNILKNKLGILNSQELELAELKALSKAYIEVFNKYEDNYKFSSKDICNLHRIFLGEIFTWAGNYRTVDLSSGDIHWCHAQYIPGAMENFNKILQVYTPFKDNMPKEEILKRLSEIHGELIIIHPFRDGNGRTTRLLCDILLMQAGYKPLDIETFSKKEKLEDYHTTIRAVWSKKDYSKLSEFFSSLLEKL